MKITADEVRQVAQLARLAPDPEDLEKLAGQLASILDYMDKLNQVDTSGVAATSHAVGLTNALREDRAHDHLPREQALANAPRQDDGSFIVPRVIG
ncbi:MAG: Asp-tRNA(Asn)/Glu-tRNA(Gln) amidotransferase subunit GatC [Desulfosarcinaceae bacterium]